jgi:hypothetical protein
MKKSILLSISGVLATASAGAILIACGDDSGVSPVHEGGVTDGTSGDSAGDSTLSDSGNQTDSGNHPDSSPAMDAGADTSPQSDASDAEAGPPPPPTLGAQIDRFGRPAINTALNHSFDPNATTAGMAKDIYNADTDAGGWVAAYSPEFQANLAILDSLDTTDAGNGCGNQPFANNDAGAARYATLGGVLAADKLWINTAATACSQYLAVELMATGVLPAPDGGPGECGGRKLTYDVIQTTYSIAAGVGLSGFGSGVSAVQAKVSGTTFPYLAPPQ